MSTLRTAASAALLIVISPAFAWGEPPEQDDQGRQRIRSVRVLEVEGAPTQSPAPTPAQRAAPPADGQQFASYPYPPNGGYYGGGYGLFPSYRVSRRDYRDAYDISRQTERYRQNVFELQQEAARRGLYIPLRQPGGVGVESPDPLNSFYGYGGELEYYRQQELYIREQMTRAVFTDFSVAGSQYFREGAYRQAARSFVAAADKDQEDAASRLMAGQALLASGAYDKSLDYFRRAVELQPLILNFPTRLRDEYGVGLRRDFDLHLDRLRRYCNENRKDGDAWLLLACVSYFGETPEYAEPALRRARMLDPRDDLVIRMWDAIVVADPN